MRLTLLFIFCIIFNFSTINAAEYELKGLGNHDVKVMVGSQWKPIGINDQGQIFGTIQENFCFKHFFFDPLAGFTWIDLPDENLDIKPEYMNNKGQIIFKYPETFQNEIYIWNSTDKFRVWITSNPFFSVEGFNDFGQLMTQGFSHKNCYCLWDNGKNVADMDCKFNFENEVSNLGYTGYSIIGINNSNQLIGYLDYEKYGTFKKTIVQVPFLWENGIFHTLPNELNDTKIVDYNDVGDFLIRKIDINNQIFSYIWSKNANVIKLPDDFVGFKINDRLEVLGINIKTDETLRNIYKTEKSGSLVTDGQTYAIWRKGKVDPLSELIGKPFLFNTNNRIPYKKVEEKTGYELRGRPISVLLPFDTADFDKITKIVDFNNRGQILCLGKIYGHEIPCIIQPAAKSQDNQ